MKKQFLMLVAIVVLALPLKGNALAPQLCEDEIVAAIVMQTTDMLSCLETLTADERLAYYETNAFAMQNAQLQETFENLSVSSQVSAFTEFKRLLIGSVHKMNAQAFTECDVMYLADLDYCFTAHGGSGKAYNQCVANAYLVYQRCLAP